MKYYSTQRPVMPGSYPKPQGNKVEEICNFDERKFCPEIGEDAWGWIEYKLPLSPVLARDWELVTAKDWVIIPKSKFIQWIYDNYNVPGDNRTLAPAMLDGIIDYAEEMTCREGTAAAQEFLHRMLPSLPEDVIRRVEL